MKEQRFKVGDKVTYKNRKDCVNRDGTKGGYYHGGDDQGGFVGEILDYWGYAEDMGCYKISVTTIYGNWFGMLECEFIEYDKPEVSSELFPIY